MTTTISLVTRACMYEYARRAGLATKLRWPARLSAGGARLSGYIEEKEEEAYGATSFSPPPPWL